MSFFRAARAALAGRSRVRRIFAFSPAVISSVIVVLVLVLASLSLSCGNKYTPSSPNHSAYVTLPAKGNVVLLHIDGNTGIISVGAETPEILDATPTGLVLTPSKKFLYTVNAFADTISIFNVASDGTLALSNAGVPTGGSSPYAAVIDPSGKYLLVTNSLSASVSVFSIDSTTGDLTLTGNPVFANADPSEILILPTGNFVYVTNPGIGTVTIFSFSNGVLAQQQGFSPVISGAGASGMAVDSSGQYLYVANSLATNLPPFTTTTGNISAFNIDPTTGGLTPVLGSPFVSSSGSNPTELAVDPSGKFLYSTAPSSADSIWCFTIDSTSGELTAVSSSPFSLAAGGQFAHFDPDGGYFYIGNASGSAIEGYTYDPNSGTLTPIKFSPFDLGAAPGKMVFSE
jgi:6-phosphogluconolactonase